MDVFTNEFFSGFRRIPHGIIIVEKNVNWKRKNFQMNTGLSSNLIKT